MKLNNLTINFDEIAKNYDKNAVLQKEIAERLIDHLEPIRIQPETILDLGAKTGFTTKNLRKIFPNSTIIAAEISEQMLKKTRRNAGFFQKQDCVALDFQQLPFVDNCFDLIFANLAFYWCENLKEIFAEIYRVLRPKGLFIFSTLGPDTFKEIIKNNFIDMHDIGDQLMQEKFADPVMEMEYLTFTYSSFEKLSEDLKLLGYQNIIDYKNFVNAITFEIIYGHTWITDSKNKQVADEISIPISAIKRK